MTNEQAIERLKELLEQAERDWGVEADARKIREEQIEAIAAELGSDAEWTSACDLGWHTRDLAGAIAGELDMLKAKFEDESKRADDYCRRYLDTRQALAELVRLKERKDKYGKTPAYEKCQPEAWTEARRVLNLPDIG